MTQAIAPKTSLYDHDYLLWTEETVAKLKARDFNQVDIENLIEEIESLGRSEKRELQSRLKTLLEHLLKRMYINMPRYFGGWENTIRTQRSEIELLLIASPSLKASWNESFDITWRLALKDVRGEYSKKGFTFPDVWQFSRDVDAMLNVDFWGDF
jgi:hypothetical protein